MALTVSPAVRVVALVGILSALAFAAAMSRMGSSGSAEPAPSLSQNLLVERSQSVTQRKATAPARPSAKKAERAVPKVQPVVRTRGAERLSAAMAAGLPLSLARALAQSSTVVVVIYNPRSEVDGIAFAEARAGAELAGVPFVPLSVLSQSDVGKLTEQLGLLPDPAVLVFGRPATLVGRMDGFADKETVAQAAQNAASGY